MSPPQGSTVHVGRKDGGDKVHNILSDDTYKKMYDHSPHSVSICYCPYAQSGKLKYLVSKLKKILLISSIPWLSGVDVDEKMLRD